MSAKRLEEAAAEAATTVVEARQMLEQWRSRVDDAQAELAKAESMAGEELLDDPEAAASWPARVREARDQVAVAKRAAAAQEPRVIAAERAWCRAQATLLEAVEVVPARKALQAHQDRTRELLAALQEHNGPYVTQYELASAQRASSKVINTTAVEWRLPKSYVLQVALARADVRHSVLATMAHGEDPTVLVLGRSYAGEISEEDCYPEQVRATGLVPAPAYAGRVAAARAAVVELERLPAELEAEMAQFEEDVVRGQRLPSDAALSVARRQARLEEIPDELDAARQQLASLTGQAV